ncbi:MAG: hypothetical protein K2J80_13575 [Oscillospiraceae bacterium]|nr:hypothetical protein [Oscillospiraceae bacterium]
MNKKTMNPFARMCKTVLMFAALPIVVVGLLIWAAAIFGRAGIETMLKNGSALRDKAEAKPALRQSGGSGEARQTSAGHKKLPLALASTLAAKVEGWY